jgi:hypothetical protein
VEKRQSRPTEKRQAKCTIYFVTLPKDLSIESGDRPSAQLPMPNENEMRAQTKCVDGHTDVFVQ